MISYHPNTETRTPMKAIYQNLRAWELPDTWRGRKAKIAALEQRVELDAQCIEKLRAHILELELKLAEAKRTAIHYEHMTEARRDLMAAQGAVINGLRAQADIMSPLIDTTMEIARARENVCELIQVVQECRSALELVRRESI